MTTRTSPAPRRPLRHPLVALAIGLLTVVAAGLVAPPAHATFALGSYRAALTPATLAPGTGAPVTVTITNNAPLGSVLPLTEADVTVPAGLTATAVRIAAGPSSFTAVLSGATVRLRSSGLPLLHGLRPGASVAVAITLDAPAAGTFTFATRAAGPINGTLAPFARTGPEPVLTVGAAAAALRFGVQPTSTTTGTPITPAVTVRVVDAAGAPVSGFTGTVTIGYGTAPGGTPPPSGATATAVDGVATFPQLAVPAPGLGYTLVATGGGLTSPPSDPFDVGDSVTPCAPDSPCDSGTVDAADGTARIRVQADPAATADAITVFFDGTLLSCQRPGATATFNVDNRTKTITYTSLRGDAETVRSGDTGPSGAPVCFGSPTPFPTAGGGTAVFNPANDEFEGLLPDCARTATAGTVTDPCVASRAPLKSRSDGRGTGYDDGNGGVVVTVLAPAGDPRMTT